VTTQEVKNLNVKKLQRLDITDRKNNVQQSRFILKKRRETKRKK